MDPLDAYNDSVNRRLSIAAFLTVALMIGAGAILACSAAQVPDRAERARLAVEGAKVACEQLYRTPPESIPAEVHVACETLLGPDDAPVSEEPAMGDPPDGGPGQGVRAVDGG